MRQPWTVRETTVKESTDHRGRSLKHTILAAIAISVHLYTRNVSHTSDALSQHIGFLNSRIAYAFVISIQFASMWLAILWIGYSNARPKN